MDASVVAFVLCMVYDRSMSRTPRRIDGTLIKPVVESQGRRNDWIAATLGVPEYTVSRWFNGTTPILESDAVRLLTILGVPFYLVFGFHPRNEKESFTELSERIPA